MEPANAFVFRTLMDPATSTYTYLLGDRASGEALLIDPVLEQVERDIRLLDELGLRLLHTLETHVHADHVTGAGRLRARLGASVGVAAVAQVTGADRALVHGDVVNVGSLALEVRATPGHTSGCLTYVLRRPPRTLVFTGDALLIRGCGRTDFQQGDAATLYRSVHQQIFTLPDDAEVFPGHDYRGHLSSTVGEEKAHNLRLGAGRDQASFEALMDNLGLAYPKRIDEAVPANLQCGDV